MLKFQVGIALLLDNMQDIQLKGLDKGVIYNYDVEIGAIADQHKWFKVMMGRRKPQVVREYNSRISVDV